ncbi:low temperature requirement protein A [Streptomyces yerevanensis]|uniref:low temperature requirement protein A n=1 Tax=Streptomyces yerevanensis TaxID=66378 RepID=UPI000A71E2EF
MQLTSDPARREVTPLELFFDLVYVFAIGQLSHRLLVHPTWIGAAQALVLYLAVYAAWAYTTWAVTLVPAENPRTRRMLLAVMLTGLFMNAAIPRAFGDAGWVFVATFLLIHIGRTVWLLTVGLDPVNQEHFLRVLVWFVGAAPLWLIGAAVDGGARLTWWAAAILVELASTWAAHPLPGRRLDSRRSDSTSVPGPPRKQRSPSPRRSSPTPTTAPAGPCPTARSPSTRLSTAPSQQRPPLPQRLTYVHAGRRPCERPSR